MDNFWTDTTVSQGIVTMFVRYCDVHFWCALGLPGHYLGWSLNHDDDNGILIIKIVIIILALYY